MLLPADKDMPDYLAGMLAYWGGLDTRGLPKLQHVEGWIDAFRYDEEYGLWS